MWALNGIKGNAVSDIEIGSVWINRATNLMVTVDAVDDMRVYYSIGGNQWNPLVGWFTKMFDETDIKIGSVWLCEKTGEEVTVRNVDDKLEERPCVWFAYKDGAESLLSVHKFTERFTKVFCSETKDSKTDADRNKFGLVGRPIGILAQARKDSETKAVQILNEAVQIMAERGKSYDKSGGQAERSMPKIVAMFNALTGHELTPAQGWKFMACLKLARSEQGEHREDNYLDGAAYFALAGEEAGEGEQ